MKTFAVFVGVLIIIGCIAGWASFWLRYATAAVDLSITRLAVSIVMAVGVPIAAVIAALFWLNTAIPPQ